MAPKTPEERAEWIAQMKAKVAALSPEERERRYGALIAAIKPDLMIIDEDGDALAVDDVSDERGRAIYIDVCASGTDDGMAVRFDEGRARALRDHLTAWLDAPRLAARESAEVVAEDDGVTLLKTSVGEWGVRVDDGNAPGEFRIGWCSDEESARRAFDAECEKVTCEDCEKRIDLDDAHDAGDCYLCDDCHEKAVEAFKVTRYACTDSACGWSGMGPETERDDDGAPECPRCGEYVDEQASPAEVATP